MSTGPYDDLGEVLLEFQRIGSAMKVTAIHAATGIEAVIQGPANAAESTLRTNAVNKLKYILARRNQT